jgi:hypothetical protein
MARRRRWNLKIRGKRMRRYSLQAAMPFQPCEAEVRGERVRFRYNTASQVLRARFRLRRGTLAVTACG